MSKKAIILLSGGVDSSVCLAIAKAQGFACYALSIDYQQRNKHELKCAALIAQQLGAIEHRIIACDIGAWGGSALTDHSLVMDRVADRSVNTYVPARNIIFLSLALGWAEALGAADIFFAANAHDYDNYPDCRPEFFAAFTSASHLATRIGVNGDRCQIHTPLLHWDKTQIIREGTRLNIDFSQTFSCYDPIATSQPCEQCLACRLRTQGFASEKLYRATLAVENDTELNAEMQDWEITIDDGITDDESR